MGRRCADPNIYIWSVRRLLIHHLNKIIGQKHREPLCKGGGNRPGNYSSSLLRLTHHIARCIKSIMMLFTRLNLIA